MTRVLGIESSCDECAVAVVEDGQRLIAGRIASLADDFAAWGGVVPELAARGHVASLPTLIDEVLRELNMQCADIDVIAVSAWPGLIGSLHIGVTAAKMLAARLNKPLVAVDHIQAHLAAVHLDHSSITYPAIGLVASGGHSHYYLCHAPGDVSCIGGTIDDAAGEAFDKAAAVLGLGYPGGPLVDARAAHGSPRAVPLPRPFIKDDTIRLSFAGLKTAFLYKMKGPKGLGVVELDEQGIDDACASFQSAVVDCLVAKLECAAQQHGVSSLIVGGGVVCNSGLRQALSDLPSRYTVAMPAPANCGDNAAMIAALGYFQWQRGDLAAADLAPKPTGKR